MCTVVLSCIVTVLKIPLRVTLLYGLFIIVLSIILSEIADISFPPYMMSDFPICTFCIDILLSCTPWAIIIFCFVFMLCRFTPAFLIIMFFSYVLSLVYLYIMSLSILSITCIASALVQYALGLNLALLLSLLSPAIQPMSQKAFTQPLYCSSMSWSSIKTVFPCELSIPNAIAIYFMASCLVIILFASIFSVFGSMPAAMAFSTDSFAHEGVTCVSCFCTQPKVFDIIVINSPSVSPLLGLKFPFPSPWSTSQSSPDHLAITLLAQCVSGTSENFVFAADEIFIDDIISSSDSMSDSLFLVCF